MPAPKIVDLFAGPGGLDVAAHWLGVPVVGIEWDPDACATRRRAGLKTIQGDVRDFGPSDPEIAGATILAGGPPCQTYTVAGSGAGRRALDDVLAFVRRMADRENITADLAKLEDERTGLVLEPLRWALEAMEEGCAYEAIVLEQVPAVLPVWKAMGEVLESNGYTVACNVLRTEEFGVPQTRRRAVLIARLNGTAVLPKATHHPYRKGVPREEGNAERDPWIPMGEVIKREEPFVVISNYGTGGNPQLRGRRTSDEPAATVTGKITRNRLETLDGRQELPRFSLAEAGQLQTFPVDYPWDGRDVGQQIGNAIPPRLAAHVLAAALGMSKEVLAEALSKSKTWRRPSSEEEEAALSFGNLQLSGDDASPTAESHDRRVLAASSPVG